MADSPRLAELRRRVQADPASIAFAALAEEYRRAERLPEAIETARAGLARHPSYATARVTLGRALLEAGAIEEARAELELALASAPENLAAIRSLAELHRQAGMLDRARELARRGVALAPEDRDLRNLLASLGPQAAPGPAPAAPDHTPPPAPDVRQWSEATRAALARLELWFAALGHERARRAGRPHLAVH